MSIVTNASCSSNSFARTKIGLIGSRPAASQLWLRPLGPHTESAHNRAVRRGLQFIYRTACDTVSFLEYGHDYLRLFHTIAVSSRNVDIQRLATQMGIERAHQWRRYHRDVPSNPHAETIIELALGSDAADNLGVPDPKMKDQIMRAASAYSPRDYLGFDPHIEPPPSDIPARCSYCHAKNPRGTKFCLGCVRRLKMKNQYDVWRDALIITYVGDRFGVTLGAHYLSVLKWLPVMRASYQKAGQSKADFYSTVYAVTHVVYTLNDYGAHRLSPRWLPKEYAFLKLTLKKAIQMGDVDVLGEIVESLKYFDLANDHPLIRQGVRYLLSHQNRDGSWGSVRESDVYNRYHPTWTAIAALNDCLCQKEGLSFPALEPLLNKWSNEP